jgi:putative membrane protein
LGTIGVAVAFYLGFKNSESYDRFWEARRIWGGIVNTSRTLTNEVLALLSETSSREAGERAPAAS